MAFARLAAVVAIVCAITSMARADNAVDAKSHFDKGTTLFALGRYGEAAVEYEKAFELKSDPALLYNAAQAHRLADNKQRALLLYQSYLRLFGDRVNNRPEVERHIAKLKAAVESEREAVKSPPTTTTQSVTPPSTTTTTTGEGAAATNSGATSPALVETAKPRDDRPLIKKPWFWGVVAGGAAVVALGVGLGVGLGTFRDPSPSLGKVTF
jgi:tetratricopeptide (TPR) repeat protein